MIKPISIKNPCVVSNYTVGSQKQSNYNSQSNIKFYNYKMGQALKYQKGIVFKQNNFVRNTELKIIEDENIKSDMQTRYFYQSRNIKENITAFFTVLILIFLTQPYHKDSSEHVIPQKGSDKGYYKLDYVSQRNEDDLSIEEDIREQKKRFQEVYDIDFTNTLQSIKEFYISELKLNTEEEDVLSKIDLINSISVDDIKRHIKNYLIDQQPVIYIKNRGQND